MVIGLSTYPFLLILTIWSSRVGYVPSVYIKPLLTRKCHMFIAVLSSLGGWTTHHWVPHVTASWIDFIVSKL